MKKSYKFIKNIISKMMTEFVYGGHLLSFGASGIVLATILLQNLKPNFIILIIPYLISQVVYSYNHFKEINHDLESNPERTLHMQTQKSWMSILLLAYISSLIILLLFTNVKTCICSLFIVIGGVLYTDYFKDMVSTHLAGFKNFYTSFFWAVLVFLTPLFYGLSINISHIYLFIFVFLRWIINSAFFDIKDIKSDSQRNLKTFAVIFKKEGTIVLLQIINLFSIIPLLLGIGNSDLTKPSLFLILLVPYSIYYLTQSLFINDRKLRILSYIIVDGEYIFWPILVILGRHII